MDDDELLDLVDRLDRPVGTKLRSQTSRQMNTGFLRAAEAFIQNSQGRLWVPRRQLHKRIAPGGLDYSMGEHVKAGESYLAGCLRGFREKLNMEISKHDLVFIKKFDPVADLGYFRSVYIYKSDVVPHYNPEDFTEYYWLTPEELFEKLQNGEPAKRSLLENTAYLINNSR